MEKYVYISRRNSLRPLRRSLGAEMLNGWLDTAREGGHKGTGELSVQHDEPCYWVDQVMTLHFAWWLDLFRQRILALRTDALLVVQFGLAIAERCGLRERRRGLDGRLLPEMRAVMSTGAGRRSCDRPLRPRPMPELEELGAGGGARTTKHGHAFASDHGIDRHRFRLATTAMTTRMTAVRSWTFFAADFLWHPCPFPQGPAQARWIAQHSPLSSGGVTAPT